MLGILKHYVKDQITLAKLEGVEKTSRVVGNIVFYLLLLIFAFFLITLLSFAGAYYIGSYYGDSIGFLSIAGFYLLLIILFLIFKKSLINMVVDMAIAATFDNKND